LEIKFEFNSLIGYQATILQTEL